MDDSLETRNWEWNRVKQRIVSQAETAGHGRELNYIVATINAPSYDWGPILITGEKEIIKIYY
jgi:hypothetical protein